MLYRIGSIEVDTDARELTRDGKPIAAEPLAFDLLRLLVEDRARVVGKDELVARLWHGRVVSDAAVSRCVKLARRALGDNGHEQFMIRTCRRRGYRFVGPLEAIRRDTVRSDVDPLPGDRGPTPVSTVPISVEEPHRMLLDRPSVAVLPLRTLTDEAPTGAVAEALRLGVEARLARTRWLFVAAHSSAACPEAGMRDAVGLGRRLGVRYVLGGALVIETGRLRLTATLIDAVQGRELWAERYDRHVADVHEAQDEIGDRLTAAIEAEIEIREMRRAIRLPPSSLDAWSAYLRACRRLFHFREEHHERADELLTLAARLDPSASRVFAALSFLHWQRAFHGVGHDRAGEIARAFEHAYRSVSLDPHDPQGYWVLGRAHYLEASFERGVAELRRATELDPNFARGRCSLVCGLMFAGRNIDGLCIADRACRLDSHDPMGFAFSALRAERLCLTGAVREDARRSDRPVHRPGLPRRLAVVANRCDEPGDPHERALHDVASLKAAQPKYTRDEYFLSYPFQHREREVIEPVLAQLGL